MKPKTKPLGLGGQGLVKDYFQKFCNTDILAIFFAEGQVFARDKFTNLISKLRNRQLTESLEILAQSGIDGDLALFIITNLQSMEVGNA